VKTLHHPPVFLVFEGLDGVGKTSCAKVTAELLDAHFMTTPTVTIRKYRDQIIESFKGNQEAAQMFYLATVLAASDEAKSQIAKGRSVVLDRYFLSTQVYAEFRGSTLDIEESVGNVLQLPDWTVFLEASLNVRKSRVLTRGGSASDDETLTDHANDLLLNGYKRRMHLPVAGKYIRIDTSYSDVMEIARKIVNKINNGE
jgi:dTMP kinase